MNCYSYGADDQRTLHNVNSRTNDPGIDLNPYLNFLLDINTDFPVVPNPNCQVPASSSFASNVSRQFSQTTVDSINSLPPFSNGQQNSKLPAPPYAASQYGCPTKTSCHVENGTLERLDRLETKLAKIVETVTQSCASRKNVRSQSQTQPKEARIPTPTSDEETSQISSSRQPTPKRASKSKMCLYIDEEPVIRKEKPRPVASNSSQRRLERPQKIYLPKLIPPANFEREDLSSDCDLPSNNHVSRKPGKEDLEKDINALTFQVRVKTVRVIADRVIKLMIVQKCVGYNYREITLNVLRKAGLPFFSFRRKKTDNEIWKRNSKKQQKNCKLFKQS